MPTNPPDPDPVATTTATRDEAICVIRSFGFMVDAIMDGWPAMDLLGARKSNMWVRRISIGLSAILPDVNEARRQLYAITMQEIIEEERMKTKTTPNPFGSS